MEFLVSRPTRRMLVRTTEVDAHESTLVVPNLPVDDVEYYRALVDEGTTFVEHAVVTRPSVKQLRPSEVVQRTLTAARPTRVCAIQEEELPTVHGIEPSSVGATLSQLAAAAMTWLLCRADSPSEDELSLPAGGGAHSAEGLSFRLRSGRELYLIGAKRPLSGGRRQDFFQCSVTCL